jgi:hypothetical protein
MRMSVGVRRRAITRRIAYHEAGHVVAALVLDRRFEYVTIRRSGHLGAHIAYSLAKERRRPTPRMTQAVVALAGPIAEGCHARRKAAKLLGGEDMERIATLNLSKKKYLQAVGVAIVLVGLHWLEIRKVAKALQEMKTLTQSEARGILNLD